MVNHRIEQEQDRKGAGNMVLPKLAGRGMDIANESWPSKQEAMEYAQPAARNVPACGRWVVQGVKRGSDCQGDSPIMTLQGREGGNRLRKLTTARLVSISFCTDCTQQWVQGYARLIQHPREHHAGVRGRGCRPPIQEGREQRRRKGPDKKSREFGKSLSNDTCVMQEGFNRALQFSAYLLKAISRTAFADSCQADS